MKKTLRKKLLFVACIFSIVASMVVLNAFADTSEEYASCADHYFDKLTGNDVPFNYVGSCAYVATNMLLAYYDVYWNDNFVGNQYEMNVTYTSDLSDLNSSTFRSDSWVLSNMYSLYQLDGGEMTMEEYIESIYTSFIEEDTDHGCLHVNLIRMGIDAGYYDGLFAADKYGASTTDVAQILDDYFDGIFGEYRYYDPLKLNNVTNGNPPLQIKVLDSTKPGVSREEVISKLYELLNEKTPVMYFADESKLEEGDTEKGGHVMVAYNAFKDSEGKNDCELHMGWTGNSVHQTLNNVKYDDNIEILWLEIDESRIPHVCSNNYVEGENRYCSCQVYGDLHPEHQHEAGSIISYDDTKHIYNCKWGCSDSDDIIAKPHTIQYDHVDSFGNHIYKCICGYQTIGTHYFTRYTQILHILNGPSYHYAICDCGYSELQSHAFIPSGDPQYRLCSKCGYMRDEFGGGGNVIMGKKEDEIE